MTHVLTSPTPTTQPHPTNTTHPTQTFAHLVPLCEQWYYEARELLHFDWVEGRWQGVVGGEELPPCLLALAPCPHASPQRVQPSWQPAGTRQLETDSWRRSCHPAHLSKLPDRLCQHVGFLHLLNLLPHLIGIQHAATQNKSRV